MSLKSGSTMTPRKAAAALWGLGVICAVFVTLLPMAGLGPWALIVMFPVGVVGIAALMAGLKVSVALIEAPVSKEEGGAQ
jgi:hypothetical protein